MKTTEKYFPVVMFIFPYRIFLTVQSVDEILKFEHINESNLAVLSCGTVCSVVQCDFNF